MNVVKHSPPSGCHFENENGELGFETTWATDCISPRAASTPAAKLFFRAHGGVGKK
jgi:hypothetical protein